MYKDCSRSYFAFFLVLAASVFFATVFPFKVYANPLEDTDLTSPFRINGGGGAESFLYEEYGSDSSSLMELRGGLATVNLSTRFPLPVDLFWQDYTFGRIGGSLSTGNLQYDGSTWDGEPYTATMQNRIYRVRGYLGSSYQIGEGVLKPYGGLWARQWESEIRGTGGYRRSITQLFLLGGTSFRVAPSSNISLTVGGEYSDLSFGSVKSYLSDVDPNYNDPEVSQQRGYGIKGYVRTWVDLLGLLFRVEVYGRYLDIKSSDSAPLSEDGFRSVYEPANDTTIYGVNLSWVWGR